MVAVGIGADFADVVFGNVVAHVAEPDVLLHALYCFGEVGDIFERLAQQVKYKALCGLSAYSWQCHELLNRFVDEFVLHFLVEMLRV